MKYCVVIFFVLFSPLVKAQINSNPPNIFIITTDGFRWQEVFKGADYKIISDTNYVSDTSLMIDQFWSDDLLERKKKLMPFFWNVIAKKGTLVGNRTYGNNVNVANLFKISYPGYNEILTGFADRQFIPNLTVRNKNSNILEYLNNCNEYAGKVAAFSSWNVMPYILDEKHNSFPVNSGYEMLDERNDSTNMLINTVQIGVEQKTHTRYDLLTYASAKNYIEQKHPKVLFLGLGETDEFAHKGQYDQYLQKAKQVDQIIAELWYYVQTDPFYKGNTTFIITTDHGRGSKTSKWSQHGFWVKGSGETWMAMIGPGIAAEGERKTKGELYLKQIASTIALLADEDFHAGDHPVAAPIPLTKEATATPITPIPINVKPTTININNK
ncbi:MAG: alkaline phosphatase family protein [Bacteroidetes bacterium]|nr:alkaline phosphatase family protein [Bacteroidota bacterium]